MPRYLAKRFVEAFGAFVAFEVAGGVNKRYGVRWLST